MLIKPGRELVGLICSNYPLRRPLSGGTTVTELQTIPDSLTVVALTFPSVYTLFTCLKAFFRPLCADLICP